MDLPPATGATSAQQRAWLAHKWFRNYLYAGHCALFGSGDTLERLDQVHRLRRTICTKRCIHALPDTGRSILTHSKASSAHY